MMELLRHKYWCKALGVTQEPSTKAVIHFMFSSTIKFGYRVLNQVKGKDKEIKGTDSIIFGF